jgi:ABC-type transport system involved in multi-copper enzyme maturation permease subunit
MNALLALFTRSVRELLRSRLSYLACGAVIGIIFLLLLGAQAGATATTAPGLKFFQSVLIVVLVFITLAGVSYFATAVTEEKEEGTLGLLRMTNLDPLAILLGKSTSRLSAALLMLAATFPFTLLAVTLGGISARQVFASYLALGAYLVLLANVALLASVLSPRGAIASAATAIVVFGTPSLAALAHSAPGLLSRLSYFEVNKRVAFLGPWLSGTGDVLEVVNPFRRLGSVLSTGFSGSVVDSQFGWSLALAALCLVLAWVLFDPVAGETPRFTIPRPVPKPGSRLTQWIPPRAWLVSAMAWKDYYFVQGGRMVLHFKWIGYTLLCVFMAVQGSSGARGLTDAGRAIAWTMAFAMAIELCLIGSRILRVEVRDKTLTGLAGLPLSMQHIVQMKLDGARRSLLPAFAWLCIGWLLMITHGLGTAFAESSLQNFDVFGQIIIFGYFASQIWLLAHVAAHFSLKFKWGALPMSIFVLLVANIVGFMFCIGIFVMPIVSLTYVTQLRASIYQRLEQLSGED